jgi:ABC-type sugar transport system permease subunit
MLKIREKMTLAQKASWTGRLFVLPFYIGLLVFFVRPLIETLRFVFCDVKLDVGQYTATFNDFKNLTYIFTEDLNFTHNLISSVTNLFWQMPIIVLAGLFIAIILNSKFHGRTFVRAVFFLPVIVVTGTVVLIIQQDTAASSILSGDIVSGGTIQYSSGLQELLVKSGLNSQLVSAFTTVSDTMFNLLWKTGVQMIIFLAGLQSISPTLYEASAIEGATAWENFFKITIPMLSPIILVNIVYTIVDTFTDKSNLVMNQIMVNSSAVRLGWAAAMSWTYFLFIGIILAIVMGVFARINRS